MESMDKIHPLQQKFEFRNLKHLAIVTVAAVPLTTILIILFIVLLVKIDAARIAKNLSP